MPHFYLKVNPIPIYQTASSGPLILYKTTKRTTQPVITTNFIDNYTASQFDHDAPTYWGMSGGPIFYAIPSVTNPGNTDVYAYGVVKGGRGYDPAQPDWSSQCKGTFLQTRILN